MTTHPSSKQVGSYLLTSMIVHPIVAVGLDQFENKKWLNIWQQVGVGAVIGVGVYGISLGVNLK